MCERIKKALFKITCITNMHVGNGDASLGVVDKEVEKDPITGIPIINSSGVKGAFREYCESNGFTAKDIKDIFGSSNKVMGDMKEPTSGKLKFLSAHLLVRPMRVSNGELNKPYCLVTTESILSDMEEMLNRLGFERTAVDFEKSENGIEVEGFPVGKRSLKEQEGKEKIIFPDEFYIMNEENYENIDLPVVARNYLENGISKNLWYEEYVPYNSIFYFVVLSNGEESGDKALSKFVQGVKNKVVQFGGNASIGYGLAKVESIEVVKEGSDTNEQEKNQ